jgi:hypothetical protein
MHLLLASEDLASESDNCTDHSLDSHIERDRDCRGCHRGYDKRGSTHAASSTCLLDNEPRLGQLGDEHSDRAAIEPGERDKVRPARRTAHVHPMQDSREIVSAHLVLCCC